MKLSRAQQVIANSKVKPIHRAETKTTRSEVMTKLMTSEDENKGLSEHWEKASRVAQKVGQTEDHSRLGRKVVKDAIRGF